MGKISVYDKIIIEKSKKIKFNLEIIFFTRICGNKRWLWSGIRRVWSRDDGRRSADIFYVVIWRILQLCTPRTVI